MISNNLSIHLNRKIIYFSFYLEQPWIEFHNQGDFWEVLFDPNMKSLHCTGAIWCPHFFLRIGRRLNGGNTLIRNYAHEKNLSRYLKFSSCGCTGIFLPLLWYILEQSNISLKTEKRLQQILQYYFQKEWSSYLDKKL